MSLFIKILLATSIGATILLSLFLFIIIDKEYQTSMNNLNQKIAYNKEINSKTLSKLLFDFNEEVINIIMNSAYRDLEISRIQLEDNTKTISIDLDKRYKKNQSHIISTIPLLINNSTLGELNIYYTTEHITQRIKNYALNMIIMSILLVLAFLGIVTHFVKNAKKSIDILKLNAKKIQDGNLEDNVEIKNAGEVTDLAKEFESMRISLLNRRKTIEKQLKFQQLIMDTVQIPIYIKDKNYRFISCNKAFLKFFQLKLDNILNKNIDEISDKRLLYLFKEKGIEKQDSIENLRIRTFNGNGEKRYIVVFKTPYKDMITDEYGIVGSFTDITEITEVKKTIEKEKMASLGNLVAGVAHEINTPVGIIYTGITHEKNKTIEVLEAYKQDELSQDAFEKYLTENMSMANLIIDNTKKTIELVKSFKQIAVDQTSEESRNFKLKEYIQSSLISIQNITKKRDLSIEIDIDEEMQINSYPFAISQIITNFVSNSVNHAFNSNKKGTIKIKAYKKSNHINLIYSDDGNGIESTHLKKIFDPFFTTKRIDGNTGLGLNIIFNIVKNRLNGDITCKSKLGKGTEFKIVFDYIKSTTQN